MAATRPNKKVQEGGLIGPQVFEALRRRPQLRMADWSERYRVVAGGPFPGRWRNDTFPPQKEIAAAFDDERVRRVVVAACARGGKTEVALVNPMLRALQRGEPVLYMAATGTLVDNLWRQKILPALYAHPELSQLLLGVREGGDSDVRYFAGGGVLHLCTAQAIGKVVGFDAKLILLDEMDKHPDSLRDEASPAELAMSRGAAFRDSLKVAEVCTVTKEDGRIWQSFLAGDRRWLQVPCPHCGKFQVLHVATNDGLTPASWGNPTARDAKGGLRWEGTTPRDIERTAHYVCPFCEGVINEAGRRKMLAKARFVPEGMEVKGGRLVGKPVNESDTASFWYNDFYLPWSRWYYVAKDIQEAESKEDRDKLKSIVQQYLALPWKGGGEFGFAEVSSAGVLEKLSGVPAGVVPDDADKLIAFIDVGARRCWWVVTAWGLGARGYVIDYGVEDVFGAPEGDLSPKAMGRKKKMMLEAAVLSVLREWRDRVRNRPYTRETGEVVPLSLTLVDSGYLDDVVLKFCRESGQKRFMASKGFGAKHPFKRPARVSKKKKLQGNNWVVTLLEDKAKAYLLFHFDADYWKSFVHLRLAVGLGLKGSLELFGKSRKAHFAFSKHLTAEEYDPVKGIWDDKRRRANHWFDCLAGCCAGADMRGRGLFSGEKKGKKEVQKDG